MQDKDRQAALAAGNNADLYEAVFAARGLRFRRLRHAFVADDDPPPYYSNITTLIPGDTTEQLAELERLASSREGNIGVKDGFCRLDLAGFGLHVLFEASWLWANPAAVPAVSTSAWERIDTPEALSDWEAGWKRFGSPTDRHMFPDQMLAMPEISFFGRRDDAGFKAGCIANISADCVGLSNVFDADNDSSTYRIATALTAGVAPGRPVVGYDHGQALDGMLGSGFEIIGPLRVWIR